MDEQTAKQVSEFALAASGELDESVAFVSANCPHDEFTAYREVVGEIMHAIWIKVLKPIYDKYPDLKPHELRDESGV